LVITTVAGIRSATSPVPAIPAVERVTWDLTRDKPRPRELGGPTSRDELRRAPAGEYVVRLTLAKRRLEQRIVVQDWPPDRLGRLR